MIRLPYIPEGKNKRENEYAEEIYTFLKEMGFLSEKGELLALTERVPALRKREDRASNRLILSMISLRRPEGIRFFYDMVSRWLFPSSPPGLAFFECVEFSLDLPSSPTYFYCVVHLQLALQSDWGILQRDWVTFFEEVRLGVQSSYHAGRILEAKGVGLDSKAAAIQGMVARLLVRHPKRFDPQLFHEMQQFLVTSTDSFKGQRDSYHLSRVICYRYHFRKELEQLAKAGPKRHHVRLKVMQTRLQREGEGGWSPVTAVIVGLNHCCDSEFLEFPHFIGAIRRALPSIRPVEGSFTRDRASHSMTAILYVELTDQKGEALSAEQIRRLRQALPRELRTGIEYRMYPLFAPRNEEEIMRHIVTLSAQLNSTRDLPQVIISFNQQTETELSFTIVLLRVMRSGILGLEEAFRQSGKGERWAIDLRRIVGFLRKRYAKEATVLRLWLEKEQFLRHDQTLDLYAARDQVVESLKRLVGEFRDYYGGMIAKQQELLDDLSRAVNPCLLRDRWLLDHFFYSLTPAHARSLLEVDVLKTLFSMLRDETEAHQYEEEGISCRVREDEKSLYLLIAFSDSMVKTELMDAIRPLVLSSQELAMAEVTVAETIFLGFIYLKKETQKRLAFQKAIKEVLDRQWVTSVDQEVGEWALHVS